MSKLSVIVVVGLGLVGLIAVIGGGAQIILTQMRAPAPVAAAPAAMPAGAGVAPAAVALTPSPLLVREIIRSIMPAVISLVLLIPSGAIVVAKDRPAEHQKWATATISSIVTYWLR